MKSFIFNFYDDFVMKKPETATNEAFMIIFKIESKSTKKILTRLAVALQ